MIYVRHKKVCVFCGFSENLRRGELTKPTQNHYTIFESKRGRMRHRVSPPERLSGKTFCCDDFPDTAKRETLCTAFCSWQEQSSCVPGEQFLLSIGRRLARRAVRNFFIPSSAPASRPI